MILKRYYKKHRTKLILLSLAILTVGIGVFIAANNSRDQINIAQTQTSINNDVPFQTIVSEKPRDEIITYAVVGEDTVSLIAEKFGVSEDTIRWENGLPDDASVYSGQHLRILPVTGVSHTVIEGDTLESLAVKYHTTTQRILDYPFNEYADPETSELIPGTIMIIPDGRTD